jgi:hypothetical protein
MLSIDGNPAAVMTWCRLLLLLPLLHLLLTLLLVLHTS